MGRHRPVCDRLSTPEHFLTWTFTEKGHTTHFWTFGHSPEMPGSRQFLSESRLWSWIWLENFRSEWSSSNGEIEGWNATFFIAFLFFLFFFILCFFFLIRKSQLFVFKIKRPNKQKSNSTPNHSQLHSKLITAKLQNLQNPIFPRRDRGSRWISFFIEFFWQYSLLRFN